MLGQRTKLHKMDSVNISKNVFLECDLVQIKTEQEVTTENEKINEYLKIQTPNEKAMKPLSSSSSRTDKKELNRLCHPESNGEGSKTPPNPFGFEESVSEFFDSEINEIGPWSVFKTKHTGIKSPSICSSRSGMSCSSLLDAVLEIPSKVPPRKNFKTKLFDRGESSVVLSKSKEKNLQSVVGSSVLMVKDKKEKSTECLVWPHTSNNVKEISKVNGSEFRTIDDEITHDLDSVPQTSDGETSEENQTLTQPDENNCSQNINPNELVNSDELFNVYDSTVICANQRSGNPKLSIICEEDNKPYVDSIERSPDSFMKPCHESFNLEKDLEKINQLWCDVKRRSDTIDNMLEDLLNEKKEYNSQLRVLQKSVKDLHVKYNVYSTVNRTDFSINFDNKQRRKKHVVSSKIKHSPALMLTPENTLASPVTSKSKRNQSKCLKSFTELRKSFSYLKTPEVSDIKKRQVLKSACYTPKSLSFCISEQLKSLDS